MDNVIRTDVRQRLSFKYAANGCTLGLWRENNRD